MQKRAAYRSLPAATALALILPACTQILQAAWTPPSRDPGKVQAGTYAVDPDHTQMLFDVMHFGFTHYYGNFSGASGSLTVVPKDPAAMTVSISVPVASIATTSGQLNTNLRSADWLDAGRFPTMVFHSTKVTPTGADTADVEGLLTLHGITRPITLHATFNGAGVNLLDHKVTVGFQLSGTLKRSDFNVTKLLPIVADEVTLIIAAAFEKQ